MAKLRLHITMSLDAYVAGPDQTEANPLGVGGLELHEWVFPLREFRDMHGGEGGETNASSAVVLERWANIGATIMGRNMFGPIRGQWPDDSWRGWWGEDPPYHHPVFVLTHHPREPLQMQGGTTFAFVTDGIESALEQAKDAAQATSGSRAARPSSTSTWPPVSSMRSTSRSSLSSSAGVSDSSRDSSKAR